MPMMAATARREDEPRTAPRPKTAIARARMAPSLLALVSTTVLRRFPPVRHQIGGRVKMRLCQSAKITAGVGFWPVVTPQRSSIS